MNSFERVPRPKTGKVMRNPNSVCLNGFMKTRQRVFSLLLRESAATNLSQDLGLSILDRSTSVRFGYVMISCVSSQWKTVCWLVLCCNKTGACVLSYGWPCFKTYLVSSIAFLCRVLQPIQEGKILSAVFIYQLQVVKDTQMKRVILLLEHNELYSVWKQSICTPKHFLVSRTSSRAERGKMHVTTRAFLKQENEG